MHLKLTAFNVRLFASPVDLAYSPVNVTVRNLTKRPS